MTSIYRSSDNSMHEQPQVMQPHRMGFDSVGDYDRAYAMWEKSGRIIPCTDHNWQDGRSYEEGKDYEIGMKEFGELIAIPIQPESEDQRWSRVIMVLGNL